MAEEIKSIVARSASTLAGDALGLAALFAMLVVALNLPGFF